MYTEFVRKEELDIFLNYVKHKPFGKFLIYGFPGMGKTSFLHMVEKALVQQGKKVVWLQAAYYSRNLAKGYYGDSIFLIDDLDEARNRNYLITEILSKEFCCICTAKGRELGIKFDFALGLEELKPEEILFLIDKNMGRYKLDNEGIEEISSYLKKGEKSPQKVQLAVSIYLKKKGILEDFLLNSSDEIGQSYVYGRGLDLACPKILVPAHRRISVPAEVRNDVKVINKSLLEQIARKPEILHQLTFSTFEEVVCELFEKRGYNVKLTKQTRDGGKDIIILNNSILGDLIFYAECKKYAKTRPVGVGLVREFYGSVAADRVTAGIMVTSSYFTDDAWNFRSKVKGQMNFLDYYALVREIQDVAEQNTHQNF